MKLYNSPFLYSRLVTVCKIGLTENENAAASIPRKTDKYLPLLLNMFPFSKSNEHMNIKELGS